MSPEIIALQKRIDDARLAQARAVALREQAERVKLEVEQALMQEFGLDNVSDARAKLEELKKQVQDQLQQVSILLDKIE